MSLHSKALLFAACIGLAACAGTAMTRESLMPIPDHPMRRNASEHIRGTERDAARIAPDQEFNILGEVIRRFYRPMMQQARWIDPKPLAHERSRQADSLMKPDPDWAIAIVEASRVRRVCPLTEANEQCRGLSGGVLRFSQPYAVGSLRDGHADSAIVYARYTPLSAGVEGEMEFFLVRRGGRWEIESKHSLPPMIAALPPRREITDPQEAVDSLLAADRAFAAAGKTLDAATAIANMFVGNVVMQAPGGFVRGRDSASKVLEATAENASSRVTWTPVRGGVSSDLQHGFTLGYMTTTRRDGATQPGKYLSYWIRGENGWRVAVYKRLMSAAGDPPMAMLPASLPVKGLPRGDEPTVQRYADELSRAEHEFSRDATPMGLGAAFAKWGAEDAVNTGGSRSVEFVRGPQAIAKSVSDGWTPGSAITWAPEQVIVSSTGDLGVTIGTIRVTTPAAADKPESTRTFPFFTIWKRAWPTDPWRYVAE